MYDDPIKSKCLPVCQRGIIMRTVTKMFTAKVAAISVTVALSLALNSGMVLLSPSSQSE